MEQSIEVGRLLRSKRLEKDYTLELIAKSVGVSLNYISKIEKGEISTPSDEVISKLAMTLNLDEMELFRAFGKIPPSILNTLLADPNLLKSIEKYGLVNDIAGREEKHMEKEIVYYRVGASLTPKDLWYSIEEIWVQKVTDKTIFHSGNKKLKVEDLNKVFERQGNLYNGYMSLHVFVANKEEIEQAKRDIVATIERSLDKFEERITENKVALTITQESYRKLD